MTKADRPVCPRCKVPMILAPPTVGNEPLQFKCVACDRLDPLKSEEVLRWSQALRPPE
jgi:hypothetical protein